MWLQSKLLWSDPSVKCSGRAAWPKCSEASCRLENDRYSSHSRLLGSERPCPASPTPSGSSPPLYAYLPPAFPEEKANSCRLEVVFNSGSQYLHNFRNTHTVKYYQVTFRVVKVIVQLVPQSHMARNWWATSCHYVNHHLLSGWLLVAGYGHKKGPATKT